ncbi:DUF440 family protein, partial [Citrobacter freundii]
IVRGQTLSLKRKEFIEAAQVGGVSTVRIVIRHIVPNVLGVADTEDGEINDIFARVLLCREKDHKLCHILWRE